MPAPLTTERPWASPVCPPATPLHALLDQGLGHAPEYGHGLSNHLPMLLHALSELGAAPARLQDFAQRYRTRLEPRAAEPAAAITEAPAGDWTLWLGQMPAFEALHAHFWRALRRDGLAATVSAALPVLMSGVAAGAFHGLIRTAHGVAAGHVGEVAMGLAYWAARHQTLGPDAADALGSRALDPWLDAVLALPEPPDASQPLISLRMAAWARTAGFPQVAASLNLDSAALPALARRAASLYAATGNFTVLHIVTASRAMRVLHALQPAPRQALRQFSIAGAAALRASRLQALPVAALPSPRPWPEVVGAALASDDDHSAKLVHACQGWAAELGDAPFRAAATRAVMGASRP